MDRRASDRPRLLDLYSGAGGAAVGYHRAGFDVVGVDHVPQRHYPFEFHQADALEFLAEHGDTFAAIHASPPCQAYTVLRNVGIGDHPDLVAATRAALEAIGRPWVIENVVGSPLRTTIVLCGAMFGLKVYRHRWFESSVMLFQPHHPPHVERVGKAGRNANANGWVSVAGHLGDTAAAKVAMGIDWMNRDELAQAIPPAYTEWIGGFLGQYVVMPSAPAAGEAGIQIPRSRPSPPRTPPE